MRRAVALITAALLIVTTGSAPAIAAPAPLAAEVRITTAAPPSTARVLTLGDSISTGARWQAELCRLMLVNAGIMCDLRNEAVGGTQCDYWPERIASLLVEHDPVGMVILACGTNDHINEYVWGEPSTSWSFRYTVEAIHGYNSAIDIVPVLIQYADPLLPGSPQILTDWIPVTNDRLYSQMLRYPGWFAGIVDWQLIPATATYLDTTGFHPTDRGYRYMGRLVYDRIHAGMGWPAASEPPLCDLYGHRRGYTRPSYTPC